MKILFELFGPPFFLAHGGMQTQIEETVSALRRHGLDVEYSRWWDGKQMADIIHSFGVPDNAYIAFARAKGIKVVNTTLFTATCNRQARQLALQGTVVRALDRLPLIQPWRSIRSQLNWECYKLCDLNIVGLEAEANVLRKVYSVPASKIKTIPLGLAEPFLTAVKSERNGKDLVTSGTITERKRSVELARLAKKAEVSICFIGKPYATDDPYWKEFERLIDGKYVKHIPHTNSIEHMVQLLRCCRGYVLYSDYENWCLSAHEAVACGLPVLIPDQPWSREIFRDKARFFSARGKNHDVAILQEFYSRANTMVVPPIELYSWAHVASMLAECYQSVMTSQDMDLR